MSSCKAVLASVWDGMSQSCRSWVQLPEIAVDYWPISAATFAVSDMLGNVMEWLVTPRALVHCHPLPLMRGCQRGRRGLKKEQHVCTMSLQLYM